MGTCNFYNGGQFGLITSIEPEFSKGEIVTEYLENQGVDDEELLAEYREWAGDDSVPLPQGEELINWYFDQHEGPLTNYWIELAQAYAEDDWDITQSVLQIQYEENDIFRNKGRGSGHRYNTCYDKMLTDFFEVWLEPGYYSGFQLIVDGPEPDDLEEIAEIYCEKEGIYDRDIKDVRFQQRCLKKYMAEYDRIVEFIAYMVQNAPLQVLGCSGVFSNGEAIYHKDNDLTQFYLNYSAEGQVDDQTVYDIACL